MQALKSQINWCRRSQLTLGGLLLALMGLGYVTLYRPEVRQMHQVLSRMAQSKAQLQEGQAQARAIPDVVKDLSQLRSRLADFKKLPNGSPLGEFMREITEISRQADLGRLEWIFEEGPRRGEQFTELPVKLKFEGDFISVFRFLRDAEDLPRLTRVTGMTITGGDLKTGTVQVEMSMSIYFSEG